MHLSRMQTFSWYILAAVAGHIPCWISRLFTGSTFNTNFFLLRFRAFPLTALEMQVFFFSLKSHQFVICRHGMERKKGLGDSGSESIFYCSHTLVLFQPVSLTPKLLIVLLSMADAQKWKATTFLLLVNVM